jgi:hypothetical protein
MLIGGTAGAGSPRQPEVCVAGNPLTNASAEAISANENQVVIRVRLRTFNGNNPANEDFTVQFYARTTN